jgi:hypothetical protein
MLAVLGPQKTCSADRSLGLSGYSSLPPYALSWAYIFPCEYAIIHSSSFSFSFSFEIQLTIHRIYGILYLHLITILLLFGPYELYGLYSYHWKNGTTGLAYLGAGIGSLIAMVIIGKLMNRSFASGLARQEKRTGSSVPTPELRLPFLQLGMVIVPVGLIVFAWSAGRTHWIVPLLGACIFGAGMLMAYVCIQTYLVDCFGKWAASALAGAMVTRCVITSAFCIFGFQLYRKLGYAWGSMLLAFLCIAMIPIPFVLQKYGPRLREKQISF